jgi:ribosome-associated toxin RatA of RatAB toxin-antitoxin module
MMRAIKTIMGRPSGRPVAKGSTMRKNHTKLIQGVCLSLIVLFSIPSMALDFTPGEIKKLTDGKLIRKPLKNSCQNGFYGGAGFAIIDAPVEVVWKALADWRAYPQMFPKTVDASEVSRKNDQSLVKVLLGHKILNIKYHIAVSRDWNKKTISFKLADAMPHDIDGARGYWKLIPQKDGRTLVAYAVSIRVPAGIVAFLGKSAEKSLERNVIGLPRFLKKYIEKDAPPGRYGKMTANAK